MNGDSVAYLVLSLPGGQTGINSSPTQILREFPAMVVNDEAKAGTLTILSRLKILEWKAVTASETDELAKELTRMVPQLKYEADCQVEIRFNDLIYELVWKLQGDDLIDREHTPQTKAFIRIVLGTLAHFERKHHE